MSRALDRRPQRTSRALLGALLVVTSIGWAGLEHSIAAAPAELISITPGSSAPLADDSYTPSVSGDGNLVAFYGSSFNGTDALYTVYIRNRAAGTTTTIPNLPTQVTAVPGTANPAISRDGCHVAFWGRYFFDYPAGQWNIYTWNRCVANDTPIDVADGVLSDNDFPGPIATSADGRYIAYVAQPSGGAPPVIARIDTATLTQSVLPTGFIYSDSIDISDDGKFVAVGGQLASLVTGIPIYRVIGWSAPCTTTCTTEVISVGPTGAPASGFSGRPSVSADGRFVAFTSDSVDIVGLPAPPSRQVYVRDRLNKVTKLVTDTPGQPMPAEGGVSEPDLSPDGTQVAVTQTDRFETSQVWVARSSSGFFDDAIFDLVSYGVSGQPVGGAGAVEPKMSSNGRFVAFRSGQSADLSGVALPTSYQIWMRSRPIQLNGTPAINFGTVDVGTQSAGQNVVITNTGVAEINVASVTSPAAPFSVTANTCVGMLPAGASCVVTAVFAPTAPGAASSTIVVSGEGVSVSTSLTGTGRTPTGPTPGFLTIKPISANFGKAVVGTALPARKFVVTNPGQLAVVVTSVSLGGTGADQFAIASNSCTGSLAPNASCTIQVSATVTRDGAQTATLDVLGAGGSAAHATLRIGGEFTPTLKMNPGVVSPGEVTTANGEGFPPGVVVQLAFNGEAPFKDVTVDADGTFHSSFLLVPHSVRIGGRQVEVVDRPEFSGVFAPLLIELATSRPSGFSGSVLTSGIRNLLTRGG